MFKRRTGRLWALAAIALAPVALVLPGCSGSSGGGLTVPGGGGGQQGSLAQLSNRVLLGSYGASGNQPGGNFQITFNAAGNGGTLEIFDPLAGITTTPITVTDNGNGTATVSASAGAQPGLSEGRAKAALRSVNFNLLLNVVLNNLTSLLNNFNFSFGGAVRTATATVAPAATTNPLAGRTFEADFNTTNAGGHYKIVVGANGTDITLTGNVTKPAIVAGNFSGKGTVGPPSAANKTDYSLTATGTVTSGLATGQVVSFTGKVTALTATSVTIGGDVYLNAAKVSSFSVTTAIPNTGGTGFPVALTAGSYTGTVRNTDEPNDPVVANINVRLNCSGGGTATITITAPGATFQRSETNPSKELSGTITGYNAQTGVIAIRVTAYDADPQIRRTVTITGNLQVAKNGAVITASGNLTDTLNEHFSAMLNQFTPLQSGC